MTLYQLVESLIDNELIAIRVLRALLSKHLRVDLTDVEVLVFSLDFLQGVSLLHLIDFLIDNQFLLFELINSDKIDSSQEGVF